jgi:cytochrome c oxidase cbb3-type subunit 4
MVSGIVTAVLMLLFLAIWTWAWSPRRKRDFDAAARLPLDAEDDAGGAR